MDVSAIGPISVAGYDYPVIYDTLYLIKLNLLAEIDYHATVIRLRDDITPQAQFQSLIHEIQHAIENTYLEGTPFEERVIAGMSQGWFQVLRDSPKLRAAFDELDAKEEDKDE